MNIDAAIVDTDVVSILFKAGPLSSHYQRHTVGKLLAISFMTLAELERWPLERAWSEFRTAELRQYLQKYVVLHSTYEICKTWAQVITQARKISRSIDSADAWIAASSIYYDVPLITNNPKHFEQIPNISLISEP